MTTEATFMGFVLGWFVGLLTVVIPLWIREWRQP